MSENYQPNNAEPKRQYISIPVAEYHYLVRMEALLDVLMHADNFNNAQVIAALRNTVDDMRLPGEDLI